MRDKNLGQEFDGRAQPGTARASEQPQRSLDQYRIGTRRLAIFRRHTDREKQTKARGQACEHTVKKAALDARERADRDRGRVAEQGVHGVQGESLLNQEQRLRARALDRHPFACWA